jgi:sporulation protein YlmC with PRC-barrel domain
VVDSHRSTHAGNAVRLSQILNSSVRSSDGKTLGSLRDVTVDPQSGRIEFAILALPSAGASDTSASSRETVPSSRSSNLGTPGLGSATATGKLIPVPWQLFSQSWSGNQTGAGTTAIPGAMGARNLTLNIDEARLRTAPSFEAGNWNELEQGALNERVYSFYGVDRTSSMGTPGQSLSGQERSGAVPRGDRPSQGLQDRSNPSQGGAKPSQGGVNPSPEGTGTPQGGNSSDAQRNTDPSR